MESAEAKRQIRLQTIGNVCVITFTGNPHKANIFTMPLLQRLNVLLDQVEEQTPCSLVLTGSGKFFSAGFDLQSLTGVPHSHKNKNESENNKKNNKNDRMPQRNVLVNYSWQVLARLLVFPAPTLALFNGHAFGLGLFIGLACDHRIMMMEGDSISGFLCLPEITIGLPLGSGFAALAKCKMAPGTLRTSALTGKKWTYHEALKEGLIDAVVPKVSTKNNEPVDLPKEVLEMAEQLVSTSEKGNLSQIKMELYHETYAILTAATQSSRL